MKNREKTNLRHVDRENNIHKVEREGNRLYKAETNERVNGKVMNARYVENVNGKTKHSFDHSGTSESDHSDDYAYTSDDY